MRSRRYEIKSLLASGGMAEVWLATMRGLHGFEKKVVLKTIRPHLAENPDFIKMFKNEALLAAGLNHPNIVQILDLGQFDEQYYIAMEYVAGRTLRQIARRSRKAGELLPPWFLLRTIITSCEALQFAHDFCDDEGEPLGLVHRDVSPENIMVSFLGAVKVLDFGVAKATAASDATVAGQLKGKYAYISPEQIHGQPVDRRIDIYALGVVMYEMLTGRRPYDGSNELELLTKVIQGKAPPPSTVAPWLSSELDAIVMKAMAADLKDRYFEVRTLANDLQGILEKEQDRHSQKDLGLLVSSLFPDEPDIPRDVKRMISSSGSGMSGNDLAQLRGKLGSKGTPVSRPDAAKPVVAPRVSTPPPLPGKSALSSPAASAAPDAPPPSEGLYDPVIEVQTIGSSIDSAPSELVAAADPEPAPTRVSAAAGKQANPAPKPQPTAAVRPAAARPAAKPSTAKPALAKPAAAKPAVKPIIPAAKPTVKPAVKPIIPAATPAAKPAVKPIIPAAKPAVKPAVKPVIPAAKPVIPAAKPLAKPAAAKPAAAKPIAAAPAAAKPIAATPAAAKPAVTSAAKPAPALAAKEPAPTADDIRSALLQPAAGATAKTDTAPSLSGPTSRPPSFPGLAGPQTSPGAVARQMTPVGALAGPTSSRILTPAPRGSVRLRTSPGVLAGPRTRTSPGTLPAPVKLPTGTGISPAPLPGPTASQQPAVELPSGLAPTKVSPQYDADEIRRALTGEFEAPPKEDLAQEQRPSPVAPEPAADIWTSPSGTSNLESDIFTAGGRGKEEEDRGDRIASVWDRPSKPPSERDPIASVWDRPSKPPSERDPIASVWNTPAKGILAAETDPAADTVDADAMASIWSRGRRTEEDRTASIWGPSREPEPEPKPEPVYAPVADDDEVYDPITGQWVPRSRLPEPAPKPKPAPEPVYAPVADDDEVYDPITGQWVQRSSLPRPEPGPGPAERAPDDSLAGLWTSTRRTETASRRSADVFSTYRSLDELEDTGPKHHFATKEEAREQEGRAARFETGERYRGASGGDPAAEHFDNALIALRRKDFEEARAELEAALQLDPGNRTYESNLKRVLTHLGAEKKVQSPW